MSFLRKKIEDEIDIDVYDKLKSINLFEKELFEKERMLFEKEKMLFEKERKLFDKEKELLDKDKKINAHVKDKTSNLIKLKIDNNYWIHNAFKDLIIEGDLDKLEWIKNNEGSIHFGVIHKAITHKEHEIFNWFEYNYAYLKTYENFKILMKFDIAYNFGNGCKIYYNLTTQVLDWYKKNNIFNDLDKIILDIFEYAIKCNCSLIINWFENNFKEFEELSNCKINNNILVISKYYKEGYHWYPSGDKNINNQEWFKKYLGKFRLTHRE